MKNNRNTLWILLLCLLFSKESLSDNWVKSYSNSNFASYSHASLVLPNGVMFFSGKDHLNDAVIFKVDENGTIKKSAVLSNTQSIKEIVYTNDNNIFICGITDSSFTQGTNIFWMKLDLDLNILWKNQSSRTFNDVCEAAIQHSNGSFYVVGYGSRNGNGLADRDAVIINIDQNGDVIGSKISTSFQADYFNNIKEMPSGELLVAGSRQWQTAMDFYILKFSTDLVQGLTKTFGGSNNDGAYDLLIDNNSIFVLGGTFSYGQGSYDVLLGKLDFNFNIDFVKTYGTSSSEFPISLIKINSNELAITGNLDTINNPDTVFVPTKVFFLRTDFSGNFISATKFKKASLLNNINSTTISNTNELVATFTSFEMSQNSNNTMVVLKTDSFKLNCCDLLEEIILIEDNPIVSERFQSFNFNNSIGASSFNSATDIFPLNIDRNCGPLNDSAKIDMQSFTFCKSDTVRFYTNNTITPFNYLWVFGDTLGTTNSVNEPYFVFDTVGVFKVYYLVNFECNSDTDSVTITIVDELAYNVTLSHSTVCINRPITFEAESSDSELKSFKWNFGDPNSINDTSILPAPSFTYKNPGVYKVYLNTTTNCGSKLDSILITVQPAEEAEIDDIIVDYCKNSVVPFVSNYNVTPNNITWDFGDITSPNNNATGISSTHTYNKAGIYICTMIAEFGCNSDTDTIHVRVVDYFDSPATINYTGVCVNQPFYFDVENTLSNPTYFWEIENSNGVIRYYSSNFNHQFLSEGSYTIRVSISDNNCHMGFDTLELNVADFVEAEINYTNDPCLINAILSPNENTENVLWVLSNGYTSTSKILVYSFPETGNYEVKLYTNPNSPCVDSATQTFYFVKENANGGIYYPDAISPNGDGVNDIFTIQNNTNNPCKLLSLKIYDRWGKIVHEVNQFEDFSWNGKNNGTSVIPGAYIAFLETENYSKSFVIHVVY